MCDISWLPPLVTLDDAGEGVARYYDLLYHYFTNDFVNNPPEFAGLKVNAPTHPMTQGKKAGFWHVIEGGNEEYLADDLSRHERIRWIKPIIEVAGTEKVRMWERPERPGVTKPHILLADFSYIVVLRRHSTYVVLITAFPVRQGRRQDYRDEWEKYQKSL